MISSDRSISTWWWIKHNSAWVLLALVLISDGWLIASSTVDLPYADDYGVLIDFVSNVKERGFSWEQLWSQQSEHRPVFGRAVTLGAYYAVGHMDFSLLVLLGNLPWGYCIFILARHAYRTSGSNTWMVLAVVLLLLVPVHHENALWGISGLAFYGLAAFCLTFFLAVSARRTIVAITMAAGAVLTSAGGFLVFPIVGASLAYLREWKRLSILGLTGVILAAVFFAGHHAAGAPGAVPTRSLGMMTQYVLCFLGGAFPSKTMAILGGSLLVPALVWVVCRVRQECFLAMTAALILCTAAAAAWSRGSMGIEQAMDSRYSIFSLIALCCVLMTAGRMNSPGRARWIFPVSGMVLALWLTIGVFQANRWDLQRIKMQTDFYLVINRTRWNGHLTPYLDRAKRLGVYDAWAAAAAAKRMVPTHANKPATKKISCRGYVDVYEGAYLLGWAHLTGCDMARAQIHVLAENETGSWSMPVWRYDREDLDPIFKDGGAYRKSGFQIALTDFALPAGEYRLSVLVETAEGHGKLDILRLYRVSEAPMIVTHTN